MIRRLPWYLAALMLAGFQLYALYLARNPTVDIDYRNYFMTRSSDCWPRAVQDVAVIGQPVRVSASGAFLACGFARPLGWGRWTQGNEARLRLRFTPTTEPLVFRFAAIARAPVAVEVLVDGMVAQHVALQPQGGVFDVRLPAAEALGGQAVIAFRFAEDTPPMGLQWFALERAN